MEDSDLFQPGLIIPDVVDKSPPLRGVLRLVDIGPERWLSEFSHELLANGINFRSVEIQDVSFYQARDILSACASTLEA